MGCVWFGHRDPLDTLSAFYTPSALLAVLFISSSKVACRNRWFCCTDATTPSLDLERTRSSLAVRLVAPAAIGLQAFRVGCSLVEIICRDIFGDCRRRHLCIHGEIYRVIRAAALLPEILYLFERGPQLLRIGSGTSSVFTHDVFVQAAHVRSVTLHPALIIAVALRQSADHYESGSDCHDIHLSHRYLQTVSQAQDINPRDHEQAPSSAKRAGHYHMALARPLP